MSNRVKLDREILFNRYGTGELMPYRPPHPNDKFDRWGKVIIAVVLLLILLVLSTPFWAVKGVL